MPRFLLASLLLKGFGQVIFFLLEKFWILFKVYCKVVIKLNRFLLKYYNNIGELFQF